MALPAYENILENFPVEETGVNVAVDLEGRKIAGTVLKTGCAGGAPVYLIRNDQYFRRPGLRPTPMTTLNSRGRMSPSRAR